MIIRIIAILLAAVVLMPPVSAHRWTEQYIPIGQSPGVSGQYSSVGVIESVDEQARTITVRLQEGSGNYAMSTETRVYIDRNRWKMTNLEGGFQDCQPGRRIEIMYKPGDTNVAKWIKVEAESSMQ